MLKKMIPSYIISFAFSFMIWIYEPITMYANNLNDLWFDFKTIIGPLLLVFFIMFLGLSILFTMVYFISNKIKKILIYKFVLLTSFIIFFILYIQGNYLTYNLPVLDGSTIVWNDYKLDSFISIILIFIVIFTTILFIKKFKYEKVINIFKYLSLAVFVMLFVSLITSFLTTNVLKNKKSYIFTTDNINDVSTDKNFYIFMVDSVDAVEFENVLNNSEYKDKFTDFTFFKDTVSGYGFTRDSVPFILSGVWNENKTDFLNYYNESLDNSPLINELKSREYNINLYEMENYWNTDNVKNINNSVKTTVDVSKFVFYRQEAKYIMYKYFPFFLKKYSLVETMDFNRCKKQGKYQFFDWNNKKMYDLLKSDKINSIENKNFSFIHLEGAHVPFDTDKNFNYIKNGTYNQKILATMKLINEFLNKLKSNDAYDNSAIIILADHGFNYNEMTGRQNPLLLIKGINEHHDMYTSKVKTSHEYLQDAYVDLLDGKISTELFKNIDMNKPRRFLWYWLYEENHMVEYEQTGYAWDEDTLIPTGKEFNR